MTPPPCHTSSSPALVCSHLGTPLFWRLGARPLRGCRGPEEHPSHSARGGGCTQEGSLASHTASECGAVNVSPLAPRPSPERKLLRLPLQAQLPPRAAPQLCAPAAAGTERAGRSAAAVRAARQAAPRDPATRSFPRPSAGSRLPDGGRFLLSRLTARVNIAAGVQRTEQPGRAAAEPKEGKEEEESARRRPSRPRPPPPPRRAPLSLPTRARGHWVQPPVTRAGQGALAPGDPQLPRTSRSLPSQPGDVQCSVSLPGPSHLPDRPQVYPIPWARGLLTPRIPGRRHQSPKPSRREWAPTLAHATPVPGLPGSGTDLGERCRSLCGSRVDRSAPAHILTWTTLGCSLRRTFALNYRNPVDSSARLNAPLLVPVTCSAPRSTLI